MLDVAAGVDSKIVQQELAASMDQMLRIIEVLPPFSDENCTITRWKQLVPPRSAFALGRWSWVGCYKRGEAFCS